MGENGLRMYFGCLPHLLYVDDAILEIDRDQAAEVITSTRFQSFATTE
jgi:hypothetical protein